MASKDIDIVATPLPEDYKPFEVLWSDVVRYGGSAWAKDGVAERHFPIDAETGLPSLPEGYFWRIAEFIENRYYIAIIKGAEPTVRKSKTLATYFTGRYKEKTIPAKHRTVKASSVIPNDKSSRVETAYSVLQSFPNRLSVDQEPVLKLLGDFHTSKGG